jgi:hypothetical protein
MAIQSVRIHLSKPANDDRKRVEKECYDKWMDSLAKKGTNPNIQPYASTYRHGQNGRNESYLLGDGNSQYS